MMMHTECLALQSSGAQEPPTPIDPTASTISSSVILTATLSNFSAPSTILYLKIHITHSIGRYAYSNVLKRDKLISVIRQIINLHPD